MQAQAHAKAKAKDKDKDKLKPKAKTAAKAKAKATATATATAKATAKAAVLVRALKTPAPVRKSEAGTCKAPPVKVACHATQRGSVFLLKTMDPAQRAAPRRQARWKHYGRSYKHQGGSYEPSTPG